ncbi:MAG: Uncharacterised protein [Flavobacteriales bacterium]|nr:MAG: Uncharacterised protein [Flavobacteriales bacterium]
MNKIILKTIALSILIGLLIYCFDFKFKTITNFHHSVEHFNKHSKDSIDLIFLGSSHAEMSYIPFYFDKSLNINSHNFGCGGQRLLLTNIFLEQLIKDSKPKVIILDLFWGSFDYPDSDLEKGLQLATIDELKFSLKKIKLAYEIFGFKNAILALSPTLRNHNDWFNIIFNNKKHLKSKLWSKGFRGTFDELPTFTIKELNDLNNKIEEFTSNPNKHNPGHKSEFNFSELNKTIKFCEKNGIKLILTSSPDLKVYDYPISKNFYIALKDFSKSKNIDFINFHLLFNKLKLTNKDFRDHGHLNLIGADKISTYLINYLTTNNYFKKSISEIDLKLLRDKFFNFNDKYQISDLNDWTPVNTTVKKIIIRSEKKELIQISRNNDDENSYLISRKINVEKGSKFNLKVISKKGIKGSKLGLRISGIYPNRIDALFNLNTGVVEDIHEDGNFTNVEANMSFFNEDYFSCEISGKTNSNFIQILLGTAGDKIPARIWESKSSITQDLFIINNSIQLNKIK